MDTNSDDPWDYLTERDVARFGEEILDTKERARWAAAIAQAGSHCAGRQPALYVAQKSRRGAGIDLRQAGA